MVSCRTRRLALARGAALVAALGLMRLLGPAPCRADPPTHYLAVRTFEIPYAVGPEQPLKRLQLHASEDDGKTYTPMGSAAQRKGEFTFTARADGVYAFVVQLEDESGALRPATLAGAVPTLRVVVDTEKPAVELREVQAVGRRAAVEWKVTDRNPDLRTLRVEARGPGETAWTPLRVQQLAYAQFSWDPPGDGPHDVRLTVRDLAGNATVKEARVTPRGPRGPVEAGDDRKVIHVKHKRFKLNYKIADAGPSSVKKVEVWMTRDRAQWQRLEEARPEGPHVITVTGTGRYGFTLRPISGVGRGPAPPRGGDLPQVWVEVDETAPQVQLNPVVVGEGPDKDKILITWRATDRFLKDQPIRILYRKSDADQWTVLRENVENTGTLKTAPPEGAFEFFLRLEAADRAGNVGSAETKESIKVDLSEPRIDGDVTIEAEPAPGGAPGGGPR